MSDELLNDFDTAADIFEQYALLTPEDIEEYSLSFIPDSQLLKLSALKKQATYGPCNEIRPPFWRLRAKEEYDAWLKLGNIDQDRAKTCFIKMLVESIKTPIDTLESLRALGTEDNEVLDDLIYIYEGLVDLSRKYLDKDDIDFGDNELSFERPPEVFTPVPSGSNMENAVLLGSQVRSKSCDEVSTRTSGASCSPRPVDDTSPIMEESDALHVKEPIDPLSGRMQQDVTEDVQTDENIFSNMMWRISELEGKLAKAESRLSTLENRGNVFQIFAKIFGMLKMILSYFNPMFYFRLIARLLRLPFIAGKIRDLL